MIVVNFYGGPGVGKSTIAADVFVRLKRDNVKCELITEYAKDLVWEESYKTLQNQVYIFANQLHKLWRLKDQVDVAIMDSPLLLTIPYDSSKSENFSRLVYEKYCEYNNLDYMVKRTLPYDITGRKESECEAEHIDDQIETLLESFGVLYSTVVPDNYNIQNIVSAVHYEVRSRKT